MDPDATKVVGLTNPVGQHPPRRRVVFHNRNSDLHTAIVTPTGLQMIVMSFHDTPGLNIFGICNDNNRPSRLRQTTFNYF
jgi:hypothetical protein